jgi:hypothetical protein
MPFEPASDVVARGHALPPPFACSCTNGGLDAACVRLGGELDLRELAASTAAACTPSSVPVAALGRPAAGRFSCARPPVHISVHISEHVSVQPVVKCRDIVTIQWTAARGKEAHRGDHSRA